MRAALLGVGAAALTGVIGCRPTATSIVREERSAPLEVAGAQSSEAAASGADAEIPGAARPGAMAPSTLGGSEPIVDLPLVGSPSPMVSLPLGASGPRPVVVATHGNYDGPQWACPHWRSVLGDDVFVLCPRGEPRLDQPTPRSTEETHYTYSTDRALEAEIDAGLAALHARYGRFVDAGPVLYLGFSRGSFLGVPIAARSPGLYKRLVLIEGGQDPWTADAVKRFADGGGERVLFVCGQEPCATDAREKTRLLTSFGVKARVATAQGAGHTFYGPVTDEVKKGLPWVREDDGR